jgi:hypothetical protein
MNLSMPSNGSGFLCGRCADIRATLPSLQRLHKAGETHFLAQRRRGRGEMQMQTDGRFDEVFTLKNQNFERTGRI